MLTRDTDIGIRPLLPVRPSVRLSRSRASRTSNVSKGLNILPSVVAHQSSFLTTERLCEIPTGSSLTGGLNKVEYINITIFDKYNNNNNNIQDNVYGAVIMAEQLREFTRFI